MNDFSLLCRLLGSLFTREPQDSLLDPLFTLMQQQRLQQNWPMEQDALLARLQKAATDRAELHTDYLALFDRKKGAVAQQRSDYVANSRERDVREFLEQKGMSLSSHPADSFGQLLLAASWLEDQAAQDEVLAQTQLFDEYLLPWSGLFLGKVEAHAGTDFYRTLAALTREALAAMREDLAEEEGDTPQE